MGIISHYQKMFLHYYEILTDLSEDHDLKDGAL